MCLMFFLWFSSGIVMMYVEYPALTEQERLQGLSPLDLDAIDIPVTSLVSDIAADKRVKRFSLSNHLDRPVSHTEFSDGTSSIMFADTGERLGQTSPSSAEQAAITFARNTGWGDRARYVKSLEMDQWTFFGGFSIHRPLHQVSLDNSSGTILYISNSTGRVIRDTHAWERFWNWLGSTIHWIYPMQLRKHPDTWVNVVIVVSILGIVAVASGTIVGILRLRTKKRYRHGSVTPYKGAQKWHHLLGIGFTVFMTTFVVSGLFSMNPFGIFNEKSSSRPQISRYEGGTLQFDGLQKALNALERSQTESAAIKELSWHQINGHGVLLAHTDFGRNVVNLSSDELSALVQGAIPLLLPKDSLIQLEELETYDNYYYSTHNRYRPLPAYRATFNDREETWYYIDASTGELLFRSTSIGRVQRWLYNGLHSLDFQFLLTNRPLWDLVVLTLSVAGVVFSCTSIIIAWRRIKRMTRKTPSYN